MSDRDADAVEKAEQFLDEHIIIQKRTCECGKISLVQSGPSDSALVEFLTDLRREWREEWEGEQRENLSNLVRTTMREKHYAAIVEFIKWQNMPGHVEDDGMLWARRRWLEGSDG
jgi:hypothetical protein